MMKPVVLGVGSVLHSANVDLSVGSARLRAVLVAVAGAGEAGTLRGSGSPPLGRGAAGSRPGDSERPHQAGVAAAAPRYRPSHPARHLRASRQPREETARWVYHLKYLKTRRFANDELQIFLAERLR